jgi:hypothetical protein
LRSRTDWVVAGFVACAVAGCLHRRGDWTPSDRARTDATTRDGSEGVTLVLLGNAGRAGRGAKVVATEVERVLELAHTSGPPPMVLWLGDATRQPRRRPVCASSKGVDPLAMVVGAHVARGHESYAIAGEQQWRCGSAETAEARPAATWQRPAIHYVVRVHEDGTSRVVSACDSAPCELEALPQSASPGVLLELVMLDTTAWLHRGAMDEETANRSLGALESLLAVLDSEPVPEMPPRVLVTHHPIEAAGWHGQGGGRPDSSWPFSPPALRQSLQRGTFVGVLAARDRGLYADADLSDAIKRADRAWLTAPLLQVVSGGASTRTPASHRLRHFTSVTLLPDLHASGLGFATVRVTRERVDVTLHTRRFGRWLTAHLFVPVRRAPHPAEVPSPPMSPCLRCPEVPPNERP